MVFILKILLVVTNYYNYYQYDFLWLNKKINKIISGVK